VLVLKAYDLKCNGFEEGFFDRNSFRLSWKAVSPVSNSRQTAYQLCAAGNPEQLTTAPDLWDSGWIQSDRSMGVIYQGKTLVSRQCVFWQVRIRDNHGNQSGWSRPARFETALMNPEDWHARWIQMDRESKDESSPSPFFRKTFSLVQQPVRARVHLAALGNAELHINGTRVGRDLFVPGWTDYSKRIQYVAYDVSSLLQSGENVIGAVLGDGWYCGNMAWKNMRNFYGDEPKLLLQLESFQEDGTVERIITDSSWQSVTGPILESDHYNGEVYDARLEMTGWNTTDFDAGAWSPVRTVDISGPVLQIKSCPPVRRQEELCPVDMTARDGAWIYDLGQNMVGWAKIAVCAFPGARIRIRFAEMLCEDGALYTENYRSARSEDIYICKSSKTEIWEPHFTFHGFRYVELSGDLEEPGLDAVTGVVLHTDLPATGEFECSDSLINRLQQSILWGQKSNFFEVPTDCPQRDERLGWTGDSLAFIRTAAFNMDISAFYTKWLTDLRDAQREDGAFPDMAPFITCGFGNAGWGDAGVICPWEIYRHYGDLRVLEENYEAMCRWVSYLENSSENLICPETRYGDWLAIDSPDKFSAPTPKRLIGTAFFARCADILVRTAELLEKQDDADRFKRLAVSVRAAFDKVFVSGQGDVAGETQTGYLLALGFDLLPENKAGYAQNRLIDLVESRGHLTTGFIGTPLLNPVLTRIGRTDLAYDLLFRREYPSWLYPIDQGATTMWERWNSFSHADGFGDAEMNSFNHYAYGAIGEWLYHHVAGIQLDEEVPGFKKIQIRPGIDTRLTYVKSRYETPYGPVRVEWNLVRDELLITCEVPFNTEAFLHIPEGFDEVSINRTLVERCRDQGVRMGSGTYTVSCNKKRADFKDLNSVAVCMAKQIARRSNQGEKQ